MEWENFIQRKRLYICLTFPELVQDFLFQSVLRQSDSNRHQEDWRIADSDFQTWIWTDGRHSNKQDFMVLKHIYTSLLVGRREDVLLSVLNTMDFADFFQCYWQLERNVALQLDRLVQEYVYADTPKKDR